jgi:hypothetical protein
VRLYWRIWRQLAAGIKTTYKQVACILGIAAMTVSNVCCQQNYKIDSTVTAGCLRQTLSLSMLLLSLL